jgi:uncharacterized protein (DUF305 family)
MSKYITVSLCIVFFLLGTGVGYVFTPEYAKQGNDTMEKTSTKQSANDEDLTYLRMVIEHHKVAVGILSQIEERTTHDELRTFAQSVIASDSKAAEDLTIVKRALFPADQWWEANPTILDLGSSDPSFDQNALREVVKLLEGAIAMAKEMKSKVTHPETQRITTEVLTNIPSVIEKLNAWETEWYSTVKEE